VSAGGTDNPAALRCSAVFTKAIVRPPAPSFSEGLTTSDLGGPNYERALAQHEAYCLALEQCGLTLTRLEPDPLHPDSTFVEDTAVVTDKCAVITRPGAPSRVGEVANIKDVLADFYPSLLSIQPPGTLDGGDVCAAGDHFFIGISERTNEDGAQQLADLLAPFGYSSAFVDIRGLDGKQSVPGAVATGSVSAGILHLKSGLAYIGDQRLVVIDALAERTEFSKYDLVRVEADEAYAANCVRVNDLVLVASGFPELEGKLRELGYQTMALDMTEFQKMDGGLSCLSLRF
jgi:dimethylargininase